MAGFCKLVAQNWHKNSALVCACSGFFLGAIYSFGIPALIRPSIKISFITVGATFS